MQIKVPPADEKAIQRAAHGMSRDYTVVGWVKADDGGWTVEVERVDGADLAQEDLAVIRLHVLDSTLRLELEEKTRPLRDLIIAHAFSRTPIFDSGEGLVATDTEG